MPQGVASPVLQPSSLQGVGELRLLLMPEGGAGDVAGVAWWLREPRYCIRPLVPHSAMETARKYFQIKRKKKCTAPSFSAATATCRASQHNSDWSVNLVAVRKRDMNMGRRWGEGVPYSGVAKDFTVTAVTVLAVLLSGGGRGGGALLGGAVINTVVVLICMVAITVRVMTNAPCSCYSRCDVANCIQ